MKFIVAIIAITFVICTNASPAPLIQDVVTYSNPWPLKTSTVWPAYGGLYGIPDYAYGKVSYPSVYGSWPTYGKNWGYSSPVVAVGAKVVGNGLWNYGGYGYGLGHNKYWL
ncbi:uncharacterized protein LOC134217811 [Armigeres subalbatus]|uniref:uncharacterized protein LOC134217811 n=1 Tax=Armigeres subalbatus TaxID=124917 RepID=UPI002ECFE871